MILSIDIGGTSIKFGLLDRKPNLFKKGMIPTPLNSYKKLIEELTNLFNKFENIEGISISLPGVIEENGKSVGASAIEYIYGNNLKKDLEKITGKRVVIENDANCSILSEKWKNKNIQNAVAIAIGTGVGGSMIINGELVKGNTNSAGEFGLLYGVNDLGKLDLISISTNQMVKKHNERFGEIDDSFQIFEKFKKNEKNSIITIKDFFTRLSTLVLNIEYMLNPELIIFTGGITNESIFLKCFKKEYSEIINRGIMFKAKSKHKVSKYKSYANLFGSAYIWYKGEI
ncbi:MAG: ROK family protein [Mycoplasmataceae bacterium]|nr:ROK family protein [Mycoplasmataceae bacterium]